MITLNAPNIWQWDVGHTVSVDTADEIHFAMNGDTEALVVQPTGSGSDYTANVPNILLQRSGTLCCWKVIDGISQQMTRILVRPKPKPADYVYEETTVEDYSSIREWFEDSVQEIIQDVQDVNAAITQATNAATGANQAASSANSAASNASSAASDAIAAGNQALGIANGLAAMEPPCCAEHEELKAANDVLAAELADVKDGYVVIGETAYCPSNRITGTSGETVTVAQASVSDETATLN